jgi:peptide/nickel transport system permease protein
MDDILSRNEQEQDEFEQNQVILTPGQLILKRFFRNKLAAVGLITIAIMIVFCFLDIIFYL